MHWDRDIIAKSEIVQQIDSEENEYIRHPSRQWDVSRLEEEGRSIDREVRGPCEERDNGKLDEGYEEA